MARIASLHQAPTAPNRLPKTAVMQAASLELGQPIDTLRGSMIRREPTQVDALCTEGILSSAAPRDDRTFDVADTLVLAAIPLQTREDFDLRRAKTELYPEPVTLEPIHWRDVPDQRVIPTTVLDRAPSHSVEIEVTPVGPNRALSTMAAAVTAAAVVLVGWLMVVDTFEIPAPTAPATHQAR